MGRPRKQPANILTANIPLTTWERLDALRLKNRSVWLNRVIMDELDREDGKEDLSAARYEASKNAIALKNDPANRIAEISDKRLLVSALARIPDSKKRLKNDLVRLIKEL